MNKKPVATIVSQSKAKTLWEVKWPNTIRKIGKTYYASTYPGSDHVFIETAAKRRPVSELQGRKIRAEIEETIARARGA